MLDCQIISQEELRGPYHQSNCLLGVVRLYSRRAGS